MSLTSAINAAKTGLQVNGLRADIVATNVANANTPGYVRRSVNIAENLLGGQTQGARASGIGRAADEALIAERRTLSSDVSQARLMSSTWSTLSARFGDTASGTGLFQAYSDFETRLSNLALTPESAADREAVLDAAREIIGEFKGLSDLSASLRAEADREIATGVDVVNASLRQIEELNTKIAGADRTTNEAAALLDERQRVLDTIAEYVPVTAIQRDAGKIDVITSEGVFLVASEAKQLSFSSSSVFGPEQTLENGSLSGLTVDGIDITPNTSNFGAVSSGMFGALFTLRDQDIPSFTSQLDTLASDLVARLGDPSVDPTLAAGEPGLLVDTGTPGDPGIAGRLALNAAVDPQQGGLATRLRDGMGATVEGPPGNSSILDAMLSAITTAQSVNENGVQGLFSSSEMVAHVASLTGQSRVQAEAVESSTQAQYAVLVEAEQGESGVDIDTQMQDLLLIEQAYAANARVIQTASQLIDRLMEI